jgi:AraC family transcriptional regulator
MPEPQIVEKPALTVVGLEAPFISALSPDATNFKVIGPLWDKFVHRAKEVPNRLGHDMVGIVYGRPPQVRSHPHEMQYIAGVPVSNTATIPPGMVAYRVPAGTFAVFTHRGPINAIGKTVDEIYRVWLPRSTWQHAQIADVEVYGERFCSGGDDAEMEIWISVVPKTAHR